MNNGTTKRPVEETPVREPPTQVQWFPPINTRTKVTAVRTRGGNKATADSS